jgi:hypothetical protein
LVVLNVSVSNAFSLDIRLLLNHVHLGLKRLTEALIELTIASVPSTPKIDSYLTKSLDSSMVLRQSRNGFARKPLVLGG